MAQWVSLQAGHKLEMGGGVFTDPKGWPGSCAGPEPLAALDTKVSKTTLATCRYGAAKRLAERGTQGNRQNAVSLQAPVNWAMSVQ